MNGIGVIALVATRVRRTLYIAWARSVSPTVQLWAAQPSSFDAFVSTAESFRRNEKWSISDTNDLQAFGGTAVVGRVRGYGGKFIPSGLPVNGRSMSERLRAERTELPTVGERPSPRDLLYPPYPYGVVVHYFRASVTVFLPAKPSRRLSVRVSRLETLTPRRLSYTNIIRVFENRHLGVRRFWFPVEPATI